MGKPIADSVVFRRDCKKGYPDLADRLLQENKAAFAKQRRGNGPLKPTSLAAYLSDLDRGEGDWWRENPQATKVLLDVLELPDEGALGIHRDVPAAFSLSAFPALPPINFATRDTPWSIGKAQLAHVPGADELPGRYGKQQTLECWLTSRPRPFDDRLMDWLHVTDALEFKFLLHRLAVAWRQPPLRWRSIAQGMRDDQARLLDPAPLIVELAAPATALEVDQLSMYRDRAPLLVVARYPLPDALGASFAGAPGVLAGWDAIRSEHAPRDAALDEERERIACNLAQIGYWIWRLDSDWRDQVIDWAAARVKGSAPLDAQAVKKRLNEIDPGEGIFTQTSEVLELCHVIHVGNGIPRDLLTPDAAANREIDGLPDLPAAQRKRILRFLSARWAQFDVPWEGHVDEKQKLVIAAEGELENGPDAQDLAAPGGPPYDFRHPLIAKLLFRIELRKMLIDGPVALWAQGAFDAQRRALLDSTLDQFTIGGLTQVAHRVEAATHTNTSRTLVLAAAEILFVAVGRQIARRRIKFNDALLCGGHEALAIPWKSVIGRVLEHLDHANQRQPAWPWTRPIDTPEARLEWICACWAWSLTPAKPALPATGLFPGWSGLPREKETSHVHRPRPALQPSATPRWLIECLADNERQYSGQAATVWRDFVSVLDLYLAAGKELPPGSPTTLTYSVAWLRPTFHGSVRDSTGHWAGVVGKCWPEHAVLAVVRSLPPRMRQEVAHCWWPKLVTHQHSDEQGTISRYVQRRWNYVSGSQSELLDWVAREVSGAATRALDDLATEQRIFLAQCPRTLLPSIKRALLAWLAERPADGYPNLKAAAGALPSWLLFEHFGPDAVEDFPQFLSSSAGLEVARLLWLWMPQRALQLLQAADPTNITGLANLLRACPLGHLRAAIAVLQRSPQVLSGPERVAWVRRYLPHAGTSAIELVKLAKLDAKPTVG